MRRTFLTGRAATLAVWPTSGFAQRTSPLTDLSQVAGQWKGVASPGDVALSLEIDEAGSCSISSSSGSDKATAQVEASFLVVRFMTGRGQAKLQFVDRQLRGVMVIQTRSSSVTFIKT